MQTVRDWLCGGKYGQVKTVWDGRVFSIGPRVEEGERVVVEAPITAGDFDSSEHHLLAHTGLYMPSRRGGSM